MPSCTEARGSSVDSVPEEVVLPPAAVFSLPSLLIASEKASVIGFVPEARV